MKENSEREDVTSLLKSIGVKDNLKKKEIIENLKSLVHQVSGLERSRSIRVSSCSREKC